MSGRASLRPRRIYWRPAGGYVGFGRNVPEQPDLYETEYRLGWRIVVVCRVCLMGRIDQLEREVSRIKALAKRAGANVADGIAAIDQRRREAGGN